jgi:hypothetical protein
MPVFIWVFGGGKSELPRVRRLDNVQGGKPSESATENKPPMAAARQIR